MADVFDLRSNMIGLRPEHVHVDFGLIDESPRSNNQSSNFLVDLNGLDPALDRWLISLRAERRQIARDLSVEGVQAVALEASKPDCCSLAVLDIEIVGLDDRTGLGPGLRSEISHTLARFRWFRTITRDISGQVLRPATVDVAGIADYALISTLRVIDNACDLFVELIASNLDRQVLWAACYRLNVQIERTQQRDVAGKLAARVNTELLSAEVERHQRFTMAEKPGAYQLVLRAIPAIYRLERDTFLDAGHLLERAVEVDPNSASAHSWLAYWCIFLVGQGWAQSPSETMIKAGRAADRAVVLDPSDAHGFAVAGHVRAFLAKRLDEAAALHEIALQLNPSLPLAWHLAGMTSAYAGRLDEAYSRISHCQELAEADPLAFFWEGALAIVYLLKKEHEQSALIGKKVTQRQPNFTSAYKSIISALGHLGHKEDAQHFMQKLEELEPRFTLRSFQAAAAYRRREDLTHFVTGLRLAGMT